MTVNLTAVDNPGGSGVKQISFSLSGAQSGSGVVVANNTSVTISAQGATIVTDFSTDNAGNQESPKKLTVNIDTTPPTIACIVSPTTLWPPNHKMVTVRASVSVSDSVSGPDAFLLSAVTSNEPGNEDIQGFTIGAASTTGQFRAERSGSGTGRVYTLSYKGMDKAGNSATCNAKVTVPHDQSK